GEMACSSTYARVARRVLGHAYQPSKRLRRATQSLSRHPVSSEPGDVQPGLDRRLGAAYMGPTGGTQREPSHTSATGETIPRPRVQERRGRVTTLDREQASDRGRMEHAARGDYCNSDTPA